jgi:Thiamine pyrophosphate enzyme, central domain
MALGDWLAAAGVGRIVAHPAAPPLPGAATLVAPDDYSAAVLAEADAGFGGGLGAIWDGAVLTLVSTLVSQGSPAGEPVAVDSAEAFAAAVAAARAAGVGALALRPDFDLDADPPADRVRPPAADPSIARRLPVRALPEAGRVTVDLIVAGRGVIRSGSVPALRDLAERTGLGVLNTFTGKGMFRWDSPFHLGTACLQARDLELGGIHPGGAVLAVGVDADDCPPALFEAAGVSPATHFWGGPPAALPEVVGRVVRRSGLNGGPPALYRELSALVQPLYRVGGAPLNPARAAADIAEVLPENGAVYVEPGPAALWVARTLPTTRLGSARVPSAGRPGMAVAGALLAGLRGEIGVAVLDAPPTGPAATLLELATRLEINLVVEVWGGRGGMRSAENHRERLRRALASTGVQVVEVPVDLGHTASLIEVAGRVVAWPDARVPLPRDSVAADRSRGSGLSLGE